MKNSNLFILVVIVFIISLGTGMFIGNYYFLKQSHLSNKTYSVLNPEEPVSILSDIDEHSIGNLYSDATGVLSDQETTALFFVGAKPDLNSKVELYCNDNLVGEMNDNGENGDARKGDGIYSCLVNMVSDNDDNTFFVSMGEKKSSSLIISTYDEPTEEELYKESNLISSLSEIEKENAVNGFIEEENLNTVIDTLYSSALKNAEENELIIKNIEKKDNGISILFDSGVGYIYDVKKKDIDASGKDVYVILLCRIPFSAYIERMLPLYLKFNSFFYFYGQNVGFDVNH